MSGISINEMNNVPQYYKGNLTWLPERTIFLTRHGSHAYGLNIETSDLDVKGITIPPLEYFFGFQKRFEQAESKNPDLVIYDIRKFFQLAADCNPNIIEVLWADPSDWLWVTKLGEKLLYLRKDFLSQKAKYTFSGYAMAQLKRIRTHRRWLENPPTKEPNRADFGLPDHKIVTNDQLGAINALESSGYSLEYVELIQKEKAYGNARREWDQFLEWKKTRNPKRAELEIKFGLDTKHAMHLVRLMRMCREILLKGEVVVKRPDREELLNIRNGMWSYDQLIEWAEKQDKEMDALLPQSKLPHSPDRKFLDNQCTELVHEMLSQ